MKLTDDLSRPAWIHAKGILFFIIGTLAALLVWAESPNLKMAALLGLAIWAFCRFYYYLFYVLERYLGRQKPFAGVLDAIRYLLSKQPKS